MTGHPGPRPELFEFPFAEATAALDAIEDLVDDLVRLEQRQGDASAAIRVGWEGLTASGFEHHTGVALDRLRGEVRALRHQADQLRADLATARARRDASIEARHAWQRRHAAWRAAQRAS